MTDAQRLQRDTGRQLSRIETRAVMPNGKVVTSRRDYPLGVPYAQYRRIDEQLVTAFGSQGSRTVGTFLDG